MSQLQHNKQRGSGRLFPACTRALLGLCFHLVDAKAVSFLSMLTKLIWKVVKEIGLVLDSCRI